MLFFLLGHGMLDIMTHKPWFQILLALFVVGFLVLLARYAIQTKKEVLSSTADGGVISMIQETSFFADEDKKSIIKNGDIFLSVSDDRIFSWFKEKSGLCDSANSTTTETRTAFCTDKATFAEKTNFVFVEASPDFKTIAFILETDELAPDRVVGAITQDGKLTMLTSYYLGNEFLGFSPSGTYFAVKDTCFEATCGISVYDATTLSLVQKINDIPGDERVHSAVFVGWTSDTAFSYRLGEETKELSF